MKKNNSREEPTKKTVIRKLRDELGWSRQEMANALGTSDSSMEKYEAVLTRDLARRAVTIAEDHGINHLLPELMELAGMEVAAEQLSLEGITPAQADSLRKYLYIITHPKGTIQAGLQAFVDEIYRQGK